MFCTDYVSEKHFRKAFITQALVNTLGCFQLPKQIQKYRARKSSGIKGEKSNARFVCCLFLFSNKQQTLNVPDTCVLVALVEAECDLLDQES